VLSLAVPSGPPPTKVGIVDIRDAIFYTNEGQRDFQNLEKKFEPKANELKKANAELEDLKKQLSTQGDKLNETAHADLVKNIENKQKTLQRNSEDAQSDWGPQLNEIAQRIGPKLMEILDKYAATNGYAVVLDVSTQNNQPPPVVWASPGTNLTKPIVDAYNAQSNVPPPAAPATAPPKSPAGTTSGVPSAPKAPAPSSSSTPPKP